MSVTLCSHSWRIGIRRHKTRPGAAGYFWLRQRGAHGECGVPPIILLAQLPFHSWPDGGPGAARRLVTFLARPRKVTKGRPPRCRAHCSAGAPALPDSTRRLRNSTWRGTHNVPHCGTRSVLVENSLSSRAARRDTRGSNSKSNSNSILVCLLSSALCPLVCRAARRTTRGSNSKVQRQGQQQQRKASTTNCLSSCCSLSPHRPVLSPVFHSVLWCATFGNASARVSRHAVRLPWEFAARCRLPQTCRPRRNRPWLPLKPVRVSRHSHRAALF